MRQSWRCSACNKTETLWSSALIIRAAFLMIALRLREISYSAHYQMSLRPMR